MLVMRLRSKLFLLIEKFDLWGLGESEGPDDEAAAVREHKDRDEEVSPTTIGDLIKQKLEGEDQ